MVIDNIVIGIIYLSRQTEIPDQLDIREDMCHLYVYTTTAIFIQLIPVSCEILDRGFARYQLICHLNRFSSLQGIFKSSFHS